MVITFTVLGQPMAQPRARFKRVGAHVRTYDPKEAVAYKDTVRASFIGPRGLEGFRRIDEGPVGLTIAAYFERPKSKCSKRSPRPEEWNPSGRDVDNVAKIIMDALTHLAWKDDRQVVSLFVTKHLCAQGDVPRVFVSISTL